MEMTAEQSHRWFDKNKIWLRNSWIEKAIPAVDSENFEGMQIFRNEIPNIITTMYNISCAHEIGYARLEALHIHKFLILKHAVFGVKKKIYQAHFYSNLFDGFLYRKGRLPTPDDIVVLEFSPGRWLKESLHFLYPTEGISFYISECRLLIL